MALVVGDGEGLIFADGALCAVSMIALDYVGSEAHSAMGSHCFHMKGASFDHELAVFFWVMLMVPLAMELENWKRDQDIASLRDQLRALEPHGGHAPPGTPLGTPPRPSSG